MNLTQTGVGASTSTLPRLRSPETPIQVDAPVDGLTTFSLKGRLASGAGWVELATGTDSILQVIPSVSELSLEVTAGSGTVNAYLRLDGAVSETTY